MRPALRASILPSLLAALALCAALLHAIPCRAADADAANADAANWEVTAKTKLLVNSHTSYEFGNPYPPYQSPLSRLEFPLDSIWTGVAARRHIGRLSLGVEFLSSVTDQETGGFHDSDWEDDSDPGRLSIFGATKCTLTPSYQFTTDIDVEVADALALPSGFSVRPLLGYRWQHFTFITHDGYQYEYNSSGAITRVYPLNGDTISFRQDWWQPFLGLRLGYEWKEVPLLHRLKLTSQFDWGYVKGKNRDLHLMRGNRETIEKTTGDARHVSLGLIFGLTENLDLGLEGEYLRIETRGDHYYYDSTFSSLEWDHGVRVWSEQTSYSLNLTYRF